MNWSTYMWQQLTVMAEMDAGDFYLISMLSWVWVCVVTCCHYMLVLLIVIIFIIKSVIYFAVWFSYPCDNCVLIDGKCDCAVFSWIIKRTEVCVNNIMQFLSLSSFLFNGIMHVLWWLFWWFFVVHKMFVSCCWWFFFAAVLWLYLLSVCLLLRLYTGTYNSYVVWLLVFAVTAIKHASSFLSLLQGISVIAETWNFHFLYQIL